jgi:hypothetical protein
VAYRYESGFGRWAGSMQGADRTVWGCRETLPCLLTLSSGSTGDESGRSRRRTGERAGSFELHRCMMVVAASRGRRFVTAGLTTVGLCLRTAPASPGIAGTEWLSRNPRVQSQGLRLLLCCSVGTDDGMVLISYMYYYCYHWNVIYAIILITWGNGKRGSAVGTGQ